MVRHICGLDEAGRGPLAGPIVAVAVVAPEDIILDAVDSKKLTEKRRERLAVELRDRDDIAFAIERIEVPEINARGIGWANYEVFRRLVLQIEADEYIVDGNLNIERMELGDKEDRTRSEKHADDHIPIVSAASILAKTIRDAEMRQLHEQFPHYHWAKNKGYGTSQHISALRTFGPSPHHRGMYVDTVSGKSYVNAKKQPYGEPILLLGPGSSLVSLLLGQVLQHIS